MKSLRLILGSAIAIYIIALCLLWTLTTNYAYRETEFTLKNAAKGFDTLVEDEAAVMITAGAHLAEIKLGLIPEPTNDDLRFLAKEFILDELNLVDYNGIVFASNIPETVGTNLNEHEATRELMKVLEEEYSDGVYQRFRPSVINPQIIRKYHLRILKDKHCLLEAGLDYKRYRDYMAEFPDHYLYNWTIGRNGHFLPWSANDFPEAERFVFKKNLPNIGDTYCLVFSSGERKFVAMVPAAEYFREMHVIFYMTAIALFFMLTFLAYFFIRSRMDAEHMVRQHAEEEKRQAEELETARRIQLSQLPHNKKFLSQYLEFQLTARMDPAKEIGGDFYDYYHLDKKHVAFLVADVSGKGIPAALFMMHAKEVLKQCLLDHNNPADAMTAANKMLCADNDAGMFVTVFLAVCNLEKCRVKIVNAGHNPPCFRHADGSVDILPSEGQLIMGVFPEVKYHSQTLGLHSGDLLFLYTDGITEAMNPQKKLYSLERLREKLAQCNEDDAVEFIRNDVSAFADTAKQSDDITALAFAWKGAPEVHSQDFAVTLETLSQVMAFLKSHTGDARLMNAADELLANIINHSKATSINITFARGLHRKRLTIADNGMPWNPMEHDDPEVNLPLEKQSIGGLGILMARKLVRNLDYSYENGMNVCTLIN